MGTILIADGVTPDGRAEVGAALFAGPVEAAPSAEDAAETWVASRAAHTEVCRRCNAEMAGSAAALQACAVGVAAACAPEGTGGPYPPLSVPTSAGTVVVLRTRGGPQVNLYPYAG